MTLMNARIYRWSGINKERWKNVMIWIIFVHSLEYKNCGIAFLCMRLRYHTCSLVWNGIESNPAICCCRDTMWDEIREFTDELPCMVTVIWIEQCKDCSIGCLHFTCMVWWFDASEENQSTKMDAPAHLSTASGLFHWS